MSSPATVLPVGVGYGVVVGVGFFFAFLMCGISFIQVGHMLAKLGRRLTKGLEPVHQILYQAK